MMKSTRVHLQKKNFSDDSHITIIKKNFSDDSQ